LELLRVSYSDSTKKRRYCRQQPQSTWSGHDPTAFGR
jgi:hypothetical protein